MKNIMLVVVVVLCGCASSVAVEEDISRLRDGAPIQTDTTYYALHHDRNTLSAAVPIAFTNKSNSTIYLVNCNGALAPVLERQTATGWQAFWSPAMLACLSPPIVIKAGATLRDTVRIWGALPGGNVYPSFPSDNVEGNYRIRLESAVYNYNDSRQGFGDPVPIDLRVSNIFFLDDPRR